VGAAAPASNVARLHGQLLDDYILIGAGFFLLLGFLLFLAGCSVVGLVSQNIAAVFT